MQGPIRHHRTLFLSDLHLGALGSRSDLLLAFLRQNTADTYYLVGDILDLWHPLLPHWSADDQKVLDLFAARQSAGATIHYLRGNHDPDPKAAPENKSLGLPVHDELIHQLPDGRQFLVLHGDIADSRIIRMHAMTRLGSRIDHGLRCLDVMLSRLWKSSTEARTAIETLLAWVNAVAYRGRQHESRLVSLAKERGLDGVICGHFHMAELSEVDGLTYANCGDWMDSMTALSEAKDGTLQILTVARARTGQAQKSPLPQMEPV